MSPMQTFPARLPAPRAAGVILFCHGNAEERTLGSFFAHVQILVQGNGTLEGLEDRISLGYWWPTKPLGASRQPNHRKRRAFDQV